MGTQETNGAEKEIKESFPSGAGLEERSSNLQGVYKVPPRSFSVFSRQQKPYSFGKKATNLVTFRTQAKTHYMYRLGKGNWKKQNKQPKSTYHGKGAEKHLES